MDGVKIFRVNPDQELKLQGQIDEWVKKYKPEIKSVSISNDGHNLVTAIAYHVNERS